MQAKGQQVGMSGALPALSNLWIIVFMEHVGECACRTVSNNY